MDQADYIRGMLAAESAEVPRLQLQAQKKLQIEISEYTNNKNQCSWPVSFIPVWIKGCIGHKVGVN